MSVTPLKSRVIILVKALPQPSKNYGETVCCAGVTADGAWKRLFPVRFRHLSGDKAFNRWDWVSFQYRAPTSDKRVESCHVYEDSIIVESSLKSPDERTRILNSIILPSVKFASENGHSLALIRPKNTRFRWKRKSQAQLGLERESFRRAARQLQMFDKQLADIDPSPYEFRFEFEDEDAPHKYQNGDWEAHAMFRNAVKRSNEKKALEWMDHVFNVEYPSKGMAFAVGNMASRPQTWQLLGVIRLDEITQGELPL